MNTERTVNFDLQINLPEDADIITRLKQQSNAQEYIKHLIREDIRKPLNDLFERFDPGHVQLEQS